MAGIFGNSPEPNDDNSTDEQFEQDDATTEEPDEGAAQAEADDQRPIGDDNDPEGGEGTGAQVQPEQPLILGKFRSQDDLAHAYQELERNHTQRVGTLTQQLQTAAGLLQQMQAQQGVQPGAVPQPGEQPQGAAQPQAAPEFNFGKTLDAYFDNPDQFGGDMKQAVESYVQSLVEHRLNEAAQQLGQGLQQTLAPMQQFITQEQQGRYMQQETARLRKQYSDFDEVAPIMSALLDNPQYAHLPTVQNGFEYLYATAKQLSGQQQGQQTPAVQQQPNRGAQKRAARLPQGGAPRPTAAKGEDEANLDRIFGPANQKQGVFG